MAANNPTVVVSKIDGEQLKASINELVTFVDEKFKTMANSVDGSVGKINAALKAFNENAKTLTETLGKTSAVKNVTATFDKMAEAMSKAGNKGNADIFSTMDIKIDLVKEKIRDLKDRIAELRPSAIAGATTGDKGLYLFAVNQIQAYEAELQKLESQLSALIAKRGALKSLVQPSGDMFKNYVASLTKANSELEALNQRYREGKSLLLAQTGQSKEYSAEIRRQAQMIRESQQWLRTGEYAISHSFSSDHSTTWYVTLKSGVPIEEQLLAIERERNTAMQENTRLTNEQLEAKRKQLTADHQALVEMGGYTSRFSTPAASAEQKTRTLSQLIAESLHIDESKIQKVNILNGSYSQLNNALQQAQKAYQQLTAEERNNTKEGEQLLSYIQRLKTAAREVQLQMNRPVSLDSALGLREDSINNIIYKIQQLKAYKNALNLNDRNQAGEIKTVDAEIVRLNNDLNKYMATANNATSVNNTLARSWNYMKNRLAFYFTVGASTQFIKNLIEVRGQYEMNERALGILIQSAEKGTQVFNELSQMALVSPYTLIELSNAARQLSAYGVEAKNLYDTTRRLADIAAAVGAPIERISYALGHIQAYGHLTSLQLRQFANMGIPLAKQLSEYYTELEGRIVSVADVYDKIKKKGVEYNDVMAVINKMTDEGGRFFDFQAKMADTLKVRLANLTLAWNNMLNDIGKSQQGVLTSGIGLLRKTFLHWREIKNTMQSVLLGFGIVKLMQYVVALRNATTATARAKAAVDTFGATTVRRIGAIRGALAQLFASPTTWWVVLASAVMSGAAAFNEARERLIQFNQALRQAGEDNGKNIRDFLKQYQDVRDQLSVVQKDASGKVLRNAAGKVATIDQDIDDEQANKVWESMREQIELTSRSGEQYVQQLMRIENVSERLRQGFKLLDSLQAVNAALEKINDTTIKVSQNYSGWWNMYLLPDGLVQNIKDFSGLLEDETDTWGEIAHGALFSVAPSFEALYQAMNPEKNWTLSVEGTINQSLQRLRDDLDKTVESINKFIEAQDWLNDPTKVNEAYTQVTNKIITENQLDPQQAFVLQTEIEDARAEAVKNALNNRIADEEAAMKIAANAGDTYQEEAHKRELDRLNEELKLYQTMAGEDEKHLNKSRVMYKDFLDFLKSEHISEVTEMFRGMDEEQIRSINFQEGKWYDFVDKMARAYAKKHKMKYDEAFNYLRRWVQDANLWSIFIKLTISTAGVKSLVDELGKYDSELDQVQKDIKRLEEVPKSSKNFTQAQKDLVDLRKREAELYALDAKSKQDAKSARQAEASARRHRAAAAREQREAETELQRAFKDELQLIDKARSQYNKLTKAGMGRATAIQMVTDQFSNSIRQINSVLGKNGLPLFDVKTFAGTDNPNDLLDMLEKQLNAAKMNGNVKPVEIKELEVKIGEVKADAEVYNLKKITDGLTRELNNVKEDYELSLELEANPELGKALTEAFGFSLSELPDNAEIAIQTLQKKVTEGIAKYFNKNYGVIPIEKYIDFDILNGKIEDWANETGVTMDNELVTVLHNAQKMAQEIFKKDAAETIALWEKLLEKYGEYVAKRKQILLDYENDLKTARRNNAPQSVYDAIEKRRGQELAGLDFDMLQQSQTWITATGDLSKLADSAIQVLINDLVEFKKANKNLDPKNMQKINKTLRQLYKQQKSENPFLALTRVFDAAKERFDEYQAEIDQTTAAIEKYIDMEIRGEYLNANQIADLKQLIDTYERLKREQREVGKVSITEVVGAINSIGQAANAVANDLAAMFDALSGTGATEAKKTISDITGILEKGGQGAALGAQIGGGWGALIGGVAAGLAATVTTFFDKWSGNADITKQIEDSQWEVKKLEQAYQKLEYAIEDAYGAAKYGAMQAAVANKKLQLVELQHQLDLEKSRKKKNQDKETILELENSIISLEREIQTGLRDITNDMLGISSIGDAAESMVAAMIDAFKAGEDYMGKYSESFDEMIDNMIVKAIVGKIIGDRMQQVFDFVDSLAQGRGGIYNDQITDLQAQLNENRRQQSIYEQEKLNSLTSAEKEWYDKQISLLKQQEQMLLNHISMAEEEYAKAVVPTPEDVNQIRNMTAGWLDEDKALFDAYMAAYGIKFGQGADKSLSALQQGIQGITEDTAGALEAYMNSVSQQVYYQSAVLTEIRDAVVMMDGDIQMTTQAEMLLQLQQSYAVQMAIQGILEGWNNPSGQAVRVELVS